MADIEDADAAGEVEEAIAVNVFESCPFGARGENGRGVKNPTRNRGFTAFR
jgi:hypothetical protein